jgi:regulator of nucleoside diphosphate kinase
MRSRNIVISSGDRDRLIKLIDSARLDSRIHIDNLNALDQELGRAEIVPPQEVPDDVVTLHSTVWFRDLDTDEEESYTLVLPGEANVIEGRISVLAPIGTALLGYRIGDVIQWKVPHGVSRLQITKVVRQSEVAAV